MASDPSKALLQEFLEFNRRHPDGPTGLEFWEEEIRRALAEKSPDLLTAARRQAEKGIVIQGFEDDPDLADLESLLVDIFSGNIMFLCLISQIVLQPDLVALTINRRLLVLSLGQYRDWLASRPGLSAHRLRAHNGCRLNAHPLWRYVSCPIFIYSFEGEDPTALEHLKNLPPDLARRLHKIGTVAHEIGHNLYTLFLDDRTKAAWYRIIDSGPALSEYHELYRRGHEGHGHERQADEAFAEAMRLHVVAPRFLQADFPEIQAFVRGLFPEIRPIESGLLGTN